MNRATRTTTSNIHARPKQKVALDPIMLLLLLHKYVRILPDSNTKTTCQQSPWYPYVIEQKKKIMDDKKDHAVVFGTDVIYHIFYTRSARKLCGPARAQADYTRTKNKNETQDKNHNNQQLHIDKDLYHSPRHHYKATEEPLASL